MEIWKDIVDFSAYQVSDHGNIRSKDRCSSYAWKGVTGFKRFLKGRDIKGARTKGYPVVNLVSDNGKRHMLLVHRLVLEAFVGSCPPGYQACHNDGVRDNCRISNLRWDTPASNHRDKQAHGTSLIGSRNHQTKLDEEKVREIRRDAYLGSTKLSKRFGISRGAVRGILERRTWRHV